MDNATRRGFVKTALTASAVVAVVPHQLFSRLTPIIIENESSIQGVFTVKLDDFPELKTVKGSVKIDFVGVGNSATAVVTRTSQTTFAACSDVCTHAGCSVNAFNSQSNHIQCPCHQSTFTATGKRLDGPAGDDLTPYNTTFTGGNTLQVELPMLTNAVAENTGHLNYLREITPNPVSNSATIEFGIHTTGYVVLTIHAVSGEEVLRLGDARFEAGEHSLPLSVESLPVGVYICRINTSTRLVASRKFTVVR
ncbi:MAG: Rieske 2Fe-2S domain-containing protein [Ignavibacteria bacterium]|nr:Rieske 2Fe-2S domain-containing protein [Ignavibacteria bacterium]